MRRKLRRNPFVVCAAFLAAFGLLIEMDSGVANLAVRAVIWTAILAMSAVAVIRAVRGGGASSQTATMPQRARRWVLDEPDDSGPICVRLDQETGTTSTRPSA